MYNVSGAHPFLLVQSTMQDSVAEEQPMELKEAPASGEDAAAVLEAIAPEPSPAAESEEPEPCTQQAPSSRPNADPSSHAYRSILRRSLRPQRPRKKAEDQGVVGTHTASTRLRQQPAARGAGQPESAVKLSERIRQTRKGGGLPAVQEQEAVQGSDEATEQEAARAEKQQVQGDGEAMEQEAVPAEQQVQGGGEAMEQDAAPAEEPHAVSDKHEGGASGLSADDGHQPADALMVRTWNRHCFESENPHQMRPPVQLGMHVGMVQLTQLCCCMLNNINYAPPTQPNVVGSV